MHILLSNDDGVYAPGLKTLHQELTTIANVTVVAPDRDRSAASKSLTLAKPIRPRVLDNTFVAVDGTPSDCVHYALTAHLQEPPDMVVAGINAGGNLGDDVMYSGTVAAATEGRFLGYPSLAISLLTEEDYDGIEHYEAAAKVVKQIIKYLLANPLPATTILNINVPNRPYSSLVGLQVTRLGRRHSAEPMIKSTDPRGKTIYWIGCLGPEQDSGNGTDFYAVRHGYVSVTPLEIDLTCYSALPNLQQWAENFKL